MVPLVNLPDETLPPPAKELQIPGGDAPVSGPENKGRKP
jgi:hypothetical protein